MSDYLVRVEIFDADSDKYDELHDAMQALSFSKKIIGESGRVSVLPDGTYVGSRVESPAQVRDMVKKVADTLSSRDAAIFVCAFERWSGWLYPCS
ncbi:hypothetical protein FEM41_20160 [Jejubacter calystegiae]|uniref:DUF2622 domain-containing protein n=1 Tax=Jejubacter calystegiae TaxID=2579935 RepID=A0A4P8YNJ6_9ENTR|nr:type V toxin-antitoxin system endoribonuclease antitoxin GhoS [Jejubacter calystegiae]QCT21803.1 hypothetical protein FEM41_20160 [Jejubacter calystegiae]